jgi:hypothetical protein
MFNQTHYLAMHTVLKTWFLVRSFLWVWVKSLKPKNDETVVGPERYPKNPNPYHESSILGAAVPVLSGFFILPRSDVPTYRLGKKKKHGSTHTLTRPQKIPADFPSRHASDTPRCYRFPGPGNWGKKPWENLQTQWFKSSFVCEKLPMLFRPSSTPCGLIPTRNWPMWVP